MKRLEPNPKLAIGYTRVSTGIQHISPEAQRAAILSWASRNGVTVVAWFEDVAVSGGLELDKRFKLLQAISALTDHNAGILAVAKRDRLARDVIAAAMIDRLVARNGARIISAAGEGTEGTDPSAQLMRHLVDAFAQYERAMIKTRIKAAFAVKRSRGERLGEIPVGYTIENDSKVLVQNESEQALIRRTLELYDQGLSRRGIAMRLTDEGFKSRAGTPLEKKQVDRIINKNREAA